MEPAKLTIAEETLRQHQQLKGIIERVEQVANMDEAVRRGIAWPTQLQVELRLLHVHLKRHMQFEESDGYMREVQARRPRISDQVETLRLQHAEILQDLDRLANDNRVMIEIDASSRFQFRNEVLALLSTLRQHEIEENELIQRSFYRKQAALD